jgi:hypothetical protein
MMRLFDKPSALPVSSAVLHCGMMPSSADGPPLHSPRQTTIYALSAVQIVTSHSGNKTMPGMPALRSADALILFSVSS